MSKLNSGVEITLNDEIHILKPSLKAATNISRQFGGFVGAIQAIVSADLNAYIVIGRQAISTKTINSEDLGEAIYSTGINSLMEPFLKYVRVLQNGGREPDDEDDQTADDEGNGNPEL